MSRVASGKVSSTSSSVGIPAPSARSPVAVSSATTRASPVVREVSGSWMTTGTPSALACTSSSRASAPCSSASRKDGMVFSGAWAAAPR